MIAHVTGKITQKNPAFVVIDAHGVGYHINISLNTYDKISSLEHCTLLTHLSISDDAHTLYGFYDESERKLFRQLISVSKVGPSLSRMILSSVAPGDLKHAILAGDISFLSAIKGIGAKTSQRIVIELQDKIKKEGIESEGDAIKPVYNENFVEALQALMMLGFKRPEAEKALNKIIKENGQGLNVEGLVKLSLKNL